MKTINAVDLFCGAGGTSTGLAMACRDLKTTPDLLAINHWTTAVTTHKANHPWAKHLCEAVERVNPLVAVPSGRLNLLVASPECTNHSIARGGRPMNDQSRATAWHILKWAQELYIENILIENVREFRDWGPIGADARPLKSKKGETYRAFLAALRSLGYRVEDRVLNAANYGDATTRERLFIIARRPDHKKIVWPEASHGRDVRADLFGGLLAWRSAKEIIDWSIEGQSIFARSRPLAQTTLDRIAAGLKKFCGAAAEPFLVILQNNNAPKSVNGPVPTITAQGNKIGLCQPFLIPFYGERRGQNGRNHSIEAPLPTQPTSNKFGLVQPFIVGTGGPARGGNAKSVNDPLGTLLARNHKMLIEPFILPQNSSNRPRKTDEPVSVITTTSRGIGLVEPYIVEVNHGEGDSRRTHSIDKPLKTVTTQNGFALVEPMLVKYNGTGRAQRVSEPLHTITAKDRFALVVPKGSKFALDIRFRMLQPHELASAMGFPTEYKFTGNRQDQVKQIGNAVAVNTARALCRALLENAG